MSEPNDFSSSLMLRRFANSELGLECRLLSPVCRSSAQRTLKTRVNIENARADPGFDTLWQGQAERYQATAVLQFSISGAGADAVGSQLHACVRRGTVWHPSVGSLIRRHRFKY